MGSREQRRWMAGIVAVGVAVLWASTGAPAATVTGQNGWTVSNYPSLFAGSTPSFGGTGVTDGGAHPANGVDNNDNTFTQLRDESTSNVYNAYFQYVAPQPVLAGTVVTWRYNDTRLTGNAIVSLGGTQVQSIPDLNKTITTTARLGGVLTDTLRIAYPNGLGVYNSSLFASDISEVQVFPDLLTQITGVSVNSNSAVWWGGTPAPMIDGLVMNGWCPSAAADRFVVLDIPAGHTIGAIILGADSGTDPIDLQYWNGSQFVTFAHAVYTANEVFAMRIPAGIQTNQIRFTLGNGANTQVLYEAMFFDVAPVPEPATLSLLALGAVPLLRRRRQAE